MTTRIDIQSSEEIQKELMAKVFFVKNMYVPANQVKFSIAEIIWVSFTNLLYNQMMISNFILYIPASNYPLNECGWKLIEN